MDLTDRIYKLDQVLRAARVPLSRAALQEKLECSRATVARLIGQMRTYFNAPIEYDRAGGGYRYAASDDGPYELPGLWFNASELHALLAAQQLLANAQPGLLEADLAPLAARIERILKARGVGRGDVGRRVRILRMAGRRLDAGRRPEARPGRDGCLAAVAARGGAPPPGGNPQQVRVRAGLIPARPWMP